MKKHIWLLISILFIGIGIYQRWQPKPILDQKPTSEDTVGNLTIPNFRAAKKLLRKRQPEMPRTFYCECGFQGQSVQAQNCPLLPRKQQKRSLRVEYEHIVPASRFGKNFRSWNKGDPKCKGKNGKSYKGRKCAKKVSKEFNRIEADLYNLVPASGVLNQIRGNKRMSLLQPQDSFQQYCDLRVAKYKVEPADRIKGFVARTYLYMHKAYPNRLVLSAKELGTFRSWDKLHPPTATEKKHRNWVKQTQRNPFKY
jgi:deoxyribonuclease-1